jgi:hypothetical protein
MSQDESLKVTRAPVPGSLPEKSSIRRKNVGLRNVTVKDSHRDRSVLPSKTEGRPSSGRSLARLSQRHQEASGSPGTGEGGEVIDPKRESAVMEPRVTKTRSSPATGISAGSPSRV